MPPAGSDGWGNDGTASAMEEIEKWVSEAIGGNMEGKRVSVKQGQRSSHHIAGEV